VGGAMSFTREDWDLFNDTHGFASRLLDADKECLLKWGLDDSLPDGHVLEIGCAFAGTSAALIRANHYARGNKARVYCVDPYPCAQYQKLGSLSQPNPEPMPEPVNWHVPLLHLHNAFRLLSEFGPVHVCGTTDVLGEMLQGAHEDADFGFRMVFIDGDHTYDGVRRDLENVVQRMTVWGGGVIILHDVTPTQPGVLQYWQELCESAAAPWGREQHVLTKTWKPQGVHGFCGVLRCE